MFDDILYICLCSKWISIVSQSVQFKFNIYVYICIWATLLSIAVKKQMKFQNSIEPHIAKRLIAYVNAQLF